MKILKGLTSAAILFAMTIGCNQNGVAQNTPLPDRITPEFKQNINEYQIVTPFNNGLAGVKKNGKWGFMNTSGELAIPAIYDAINDFSYDGPAAVKKDGKWGFINKDGETIIPFEWDEILPIGEKNMVKSGFFGFKDNRAIVKSGNKYGVINVSGELVYPLTQNKIFDYTDGYAILTNQNEELFGVGGKEGKILIQIKEYGEDASHPFSFIEGQLIDPAADNDYYQNIFTIIDVNGNKKRIKAQENNNSDEGQDYNLGEKVGNDIYAFMGEESLGVGFKDKNGKIIFSPVFTLPLGEYENIEDNYLSLNQGDLVFVFLNFETDPEWKENPDYPTLGAQNVKAGYVDKYGNTTFAPQEIEKAKKAAVVRNKKLQEMQYYDEP